MGLSCGWSTVNFRFAGGMSPSVTWAVMLMVPSGSPNGSKRVHEPLTWVSPVPSPDTTVASSLLISAHCGGKTMSSVPPIAVVSVTSSVIVAPEPSGYSNVVSVPVVLRAVYSSTTSPVTPVNSDTSIGRPSSVARMARSTGTAAGSKSCAVRKVSGPSASMVYTASPFATSGPPKVSMLLGSSPSTVGTAKETSP